jgi:hypothetical protein
VLIFVWPRRGDARSPEAFFLAFVPFVAS